MRKLLSHWLIPTVPGALAALAVLAALAGPAPASGQEARGISFVGGLGWETGGPGPGLVDGLAAAGLDHTKRGRCNGIYCQEDIVHPYYFTEGLDITGMLGLRYRFESPVSVEGVVSNGPRGHAKGYNDATRDEVIISYASFVLTTTGGLHLGPLRLEAGPVMTMTGWESTRNSVRAGTATTTTLGGAVGVGGSFPISDVLVSLRTGLRYFPTTELVNTMNVPARVQYSSLFVGVTMVAQPH